MAMEGSKPASERCPSAGKRKESSKNPLKHHSVCSWMDVEDTRKFSEELCDFKGLLKLLQKKNPKGAPVAMYYLGLNCTSRGSTTRAEVGCADYPKTVQDLKAEIEEQLNIPACSQELVFQSTPLNDGNQLLRAAGVTPSSHLKVTYPCEAEVQKVGRIVKWVEYMTKYVENHYPVISTELRVEADMLATIGLNERMCERLAHNYFSPVGNPRVEANKTYFLSKNGVTKLSNLLYALLQQPWGEQFLRLKLLESRLLDVLRCFAVQSEEFQKLLIERDSTGCALLMLARVKLVARQPVRDLMGSLGVREHNDFMVLEMLNSMLEFLGMMHEHKELHTDISLMTTCIEQLLLIPQSPSFSSRQAAMALNLLMSRLAWQEVPEERLDSVQVMLDLPQLRRSFGDSEDELMMIKYYCALYCAFLITHSCKHYKHDTTGQLRKTIVLMEDFLTTASRDRLIEMTHSYNVFLPNISAMFNVLFQARSPVRTLLPCCPLSTVEALEEVAPRVILLHLQVVLSRAAVRERLKVKDTVQYLVCLPWGFPPGLRAACHELVTYVGRLIPLPVPKLSHIVRSSIARSFLDNHKKQMRAGEEEQKRTQIEKLPYGPANKLVYLISMK